MTDSSLLPVLLLGPVSRAAEGAPIAGNTANSNTVKREAALYTGVSVTLCVTDDTANRKQSREPAVYIEVPVVLRVTWCFGRDEATQIVRRPWNVSRGILSVR